VRDEVVDFVNRWTERTEVAVVRMTAWLGVRSSKFYDWRSRYGKGNEHNAWVPRDHWLEDWEKSAILDFDAQHPLEGYRRLAFMMLDADVVAVSPSSVYRVLKQAGRLEGWNRKPSRKGTGFEQPLQVHEHWHVDVSYINVCGTFYYLCSLLDGYSRHIVHWEIRETMKEMEIEVILQRGREKFPEAYPRIISDNGPQVRVYPAGNAAEPGGCPATGGRLRGALQQGPVAQRDRVRGPGGQAGRPGAGDLYRAGSQARRGPCASEGCPASGSNRCCLSGRKTIA